MDVPQSPLNLQSPLKGHGSPLSVKSQHIPMQEDNTRDFPPKGNRWLPPPLLYIRPKTIQSAIIWACLGKKVTITQRSYKIASGCARKDQDAPLRRQELKCLVKFALQNLVFCLSVLFCFLIYPLPYHISGVYPLSTALYKGPLSASLTSFFVRVE